MSEQDILNYIRKCTAILLQKIEHLDIKIRRLELLENTHLDLQRVFSKKWQATYFASIRQEDDMVQQLSHILDEFREEMARLRKKP